VTTLKRLPEFTHEAKMVVGFLRSELRDEERRIWEKEFGRPYPEAIANLSLGQAKNWYLRTVPPPLSLAIPQSTKPH
jgi:hypothetical protein